MLSRRDFIRQANGVAIGFPLLTLIGCKDLEEEIIGLSGKTMGTTYSVKVAGAPDTLDSEALGAEIDAALRAVDMAMSTYRPDSELSRINAAAGQPVTVSAETALVLRAALAAAAMTGGAFDPTIGPLVDLWGFGPKGKRPAAPGAGEVDLARAHVDYRGLSLAGDAVSKGSADLQLDLSGVAKGYGVDRVAEVLDARGLENYLVEVGGELRARGRPAEDRAWRIGIEKPQAAPGGLQRTVNLDGEALATSGNYRIFFEAGGRRYPHIIDPRTGWPVDHDLASASVIAATTMEADALSTAMLAMGPEAAMELAERHDIAAYFISGRDSGFTAAASPEFARRFSA